MKEAQEPIRITKHNESTSQGVDKLEDELKKLRDTKKKHEHEMKNLNNNIEKANKKMEENARELDTCKMEEHRIKSDNQMSLAKVKNIEQENKIKQTENADIHEQITATKAEKKKKEIEIKTVKKKYNDCFQDYTNSEKETRQLQS